MLKYSILLQRIPWLLNMEFPQSVSNLTHYTQSVTNFIDIFTLLQEFWYTSIKLRIPLSLIFIPTLNWNL
jgi:hypothetical protein